MTPPDLIAHNALNLAHLEALAPDARRLAEILGGLSMLVWGEPWRDLFEHDVWQAIHEAGTERAALELDALACAELRELAHQVGGWVMWSDGPRFVPESTWRLLHWGWRMHRAGQR